MGDCENQTVYLHLGPGGGGYHLNVLPQYPLSSSIAEVAWQASFLVFTECEKSCPEVAALQQEIRSPSVV